MSGRAARATVAIAWTLRATAVPMRMAPRLRLSIAPPHVAGQVRTIRLDRRDRR
jgi:hypothetical protein